MRGIPVGLVLEPVGRHLALALHLDLATLLGGVHDGQQVPRDAEKQERLLSCCFYVMAFQGSSF